MHFKINYNSLENYKQHGFFYFVIIFNNLLF